VRAAGRSKRRGARYRKRTARPTRSCLRMWSTVAPLIPALADPPSSSAPIPRALGFLGPPTGHAHARATGAAHASVLAAAAITAVPVATLSAGVTRRSASSSPAGPRHSAFATLASNADVRPDSVSTLHCPFIPWRHMFTLAHAPLPSSADTASVIRSALLLLLCPPAFNCILIAYTAQCCSLETT